MNRTDFQELAEIRIAEATASLSAPVPLPDGAYYLAGYAVECALKACIAKMTKEFDFPDKKIANESFTHEIERLVRLAGLEADRDNAKNADKELWDNWNLVSEWSEQSRYLRCSLDKALRFVEAVSHNKNGVLPWIKAHW